MKYTFTFFITLLISSALFSQSAYIEKEGKEFDSKASEHICTIIGYEDENTYVLRYGEPWKLEKVNSEMDIITSAEIETSYKDKKNTFLIAHMLQGNIFVFHEIIDKKSKLRRLFYQPVNKGTLKATGVAKEILAVDYDDELDKDESQFTFFLSESETKLLVEYNLPVEKKEKLKFGFAVFDSNMKEIWTRNVELPYAKERFVRIERIVDDSGNVYLMGESYSGEARIYSNRTLRLQVYKPELEERIELAYELPNNTIVNTRLVLRDNGEYQIVGFYKKKNIASMYISGAFSIRINRSTQELIAIKEQEFSEDLIFDYLGDWSTKQYRKKIEKGEVIGLPNYYFRKVVKRKDGGLFITAEQYVRIRTGGTNPGDKTYFYYRYRNILVVGISPDGEIEWSKVVPKFHEIKDSHLYSSFNTGYVNGKLVLLFNDDVKNMNPKIDEEPALFNPEMKFSTNTVCVTVDRTGTIEKTQIFSYKEDKMLYYPLWYSTLLNNYVFVYSKFKKSERLSKVMIR